jgi:hypothetical protein
MAYNLRKELGLENRKPQALPAQAHAEAAKASKPQPAEASAKLVITQACGHRIGVRYLEQSPCAGCARRARTNKPPRRRIQDRLPDNAHFDVLYDAASMTCTGTLTVADQVFEAQAGAVFHLLSVLDKMYRDSLRPDRTA